MLSRIKSIQHIWLVHIMQCRVGDIRVKRDWGEILITIEVEKIVAIIHFTQTVTKTNKQTNKQINRQAKKKNLAYVIRVDLRLRRLLTG